MRLNLRKFCTGLFISFLTLIILVLVAEFAFRLSKGKGLYLTITTGTQNLKSPYLFEPNRTVRLQSSKNDEFDVSFRINNFGYRGKDFELEKKKGVLRIFMVGDSFTFGVGAEDDQTIPYFVEDMLVKDNIPVEVINAGQGHSSPLSHYMKLRDIHLRFKPDIVILLLDFSDLEDDWQIERHLVYDKKGKILYADPMVLDGKKDWWMVAKKNSELCRYIDRKILRTVNKIKVLGFKNYLRTKIQGKRAKASIVNLAENQTNIDTIEYDHYLFMRGREKLPLIEKHWQRTQKYLIMIRDLLKEKGIGFILVSYPYGIHVGKNQWSEGRVYWGFERDKVYTDRYAFDLIKNFALKNNIPYIDTLDNFIEENQLQLFFPFDGHLTPRGNRVLARSIAQSDILREIILDYLNKKVGYE